MQQIRVLSSRPHAPVDPAYRLRRGAGRWHRRIGITGLLALLLAPNVHAIVLGRAHVWSALGAPLRAEIELSGLDADEAAALRVEIAPPEAYQDARLDYHALLADLRVAIEHRAHGSARVRLSGSHIASTPYLQLLLRVSSNAGQVTRGYTLLLDPNASAAPAAREAASGPVPRRALRIPRPAPPRPVAPTAASAPKASPAPPASIRPAPAAPVAPVAPVASDPVPATVQATEPPAAIPATTPALQPSVPPAAAPVRSLPDAPAVAAAVPPSGWHDVLPQPPLAATAAGALALVGLLGWARLRRQQVIQIAEPLAIETTATPVGPRHLDIDLTALEQAARAALPNPSPP